jgi:hypothetical protein
LIAVASVGLFACADEPECATDADCGAGGRCVASGGVFYGTRLCVSRPDDPRVDAGDVGVSDDMARRDTTQACTTEAPACGERCGPLIFTDGCGNEQTLDCGGCGANQVCTEGPDSRCECDAGFTTAGEGECVDIDECETRAVCTDEREVCANTIGGYECQCDEGRGYFGTLEEGCHTPARLFGSWSQGAGAGAEEISVGVETGPDLAYVVTILSDDAAESVSGLALPWVRVGTQCLPGGKMLDLWATYGTPRSILVHVTLAATTSDTLVGVSALDGAALSPATLALVRGNSTPDGTCESPGEEDNPNRLSIETDGPASLIFLAVGGAYDAVNASWPNDAASRILEYKDLTMVHAALMPPLETPTHEFEFTVPGADYAYFAAQVRPAD